MKKHCMIDLETLGTLPGSVVVSIGAVAFDGINLYEEFYQNISIQSCFNAGLVADGGALKFWMLDTTDSNRRDLFADVQSLREALSAFGCFWQNSSCKWIWSHGLTFDVPILDAAYHAAGHNDYRPWAFRDARDTRTLFSLLPGGKVTMGAAQVNKHNALTDAKYQAQMVQAAYAALGKEMENA